MVSSWRRTAVYMPCKFTAGDEIRQSLIGRYKPEAGERFQASGKRINFILQAHAEWSAIFQGVFSGNPTGRSRDACRSCESHAFP